MESKEKEWEALYLASMRIIRQLEQQLSALKQRHMEERVESREFWQVIRSSVVMLLDNHAQTAKLKLQEARLRLRDTIAIKHKLLALWPALVNACFQREVYPQSSEDAALMETVLGTVDEGEMHAFAELLSARGSPELAGLLMSRWLRHKEKRDAQKVAEQRIVNEATGRNAEADATGEMPN
jgi:hypothetical protein